MLIEHKVTNVKDYVWLPFKLLGKWLEFVDIRQFLVVAKLTKRESQKA